MQSSESLDYPTTEEYSRDDIIRVQKRLIEMASEIDAILRRHSIDYFISYGSLLGSIRHGGFVPWDDDFDFMLFEDNYDEAVSWLREELPESMHVHDETNDPIYCSYWSKIRDTNSVTTASLFEADNLYKFRGICIDLFKLKKYTPGRLNDFINLEAKDYALRKHKKGLINDIEYHRIIKELDSGNTPSSASPSITPNNGACPSFYFIIDEIELTRNDIYPLKEYTFEGKKFLGPNNADSVLRKTYGDDYMSPPSYEKRLPHYSRVVWGDASQKGQGLISTK